MNPDARAHSPPPRVADYERDDLDLIPDAPDYLRSLVREGASAYVENAHAEMRILRVGSISLPLLIAGMAADDTNLCSPYSQYFRYTVHELAVKGRGWSQRLAKHLVRAQGLFIAVRDLDRVVYVNNWLFSTNPCTPLDAGQIRAITLFLQARYPDRAIVFRSVNPHLHKTHHDALQENDYTMIKSRIVYLYDPRAPGFMDTSHARRDRRLLIRTTYEIISGGGIAESDMIRLAELYQSLYLEKHFHLNPRLNADFFRVSLRSGAMEYCALKKDGRIDAFSSYFREGPVLTGGFLGYDQSVPRKLGLYRLATAVLADIARRENMVLNLSAGAGQFKMLRGAFPVFEYDAVYDRHLPARRRLAWRLLERRGRWWTLESDARQ